MLAANIGLATAGPFRSAQTPIDPVIIYNTANHYNTASHDN